MTIAILDGPMGSQLSARGIATPPPGWSAYALERNPEMALAIHREYAQAGATVHTTNTFRTKRRTFPDRWRDLAGEAVRLARAGAGEGHRVAGSIAPLEDCYSPNLSPPDPGPKHAELAQALADLGVDILLCETFPHIDEALAATRAAVETGVETWTSFTAGPEANLLTPEQVDHGAREAARLGANAVLVNCIPIDRTREYVQRLQSAGVAFGAYANSGAQDENLGWSPGRDAAKRYADAAEQWVEAGATIVGGCCGTGPEHIAELSRRFRG